MDAPRRVIPYDTPAAPRSWWRRYGVVLVLAAVAVVLFVAVAVALLGFVSLRAVAPVIAP